MEGQQPDGEDDSVGGATVPIRSSSRPNKGIPPPRYGNDEGKKTAPPKSSKSKKTVSAISSLSIVSQRKTLELENEDELNRLEIAHEEKIEGIKLKIGAKRRTLHQLKADVEKKKALLPQTNDEEASSKLSSEISDLETLINLREPEVEDLLEEILSTTRIYEKKRSVIQRSLEIEKEKLMLLQDVQEEQDLDSDEERQVRDWDKQQEEVTPNVPVATTAQVEQEDEEVQSISSHRSQNNPEPPLASTSRPRAAPLTNFERPAPYYDADGAYVYPLTQKQNEVMRRKQAEIATQNARRKQKQVHTNPPNHQRRRTPPQQGLSQNVNRNGANTQRIAPSLMSLNVGHGESRRSLARPATPPPPPPGLSYYRAMQNTEVIPPQTGYRVPHHRRRQDSFSRQQPSSDFDQSAQNNSYFPQHSRSFNYASPPPSGYQYQAQPQNSTEALLQQMTNSLTAALTSAMGNKSRPLPRFEGNASDWSYWLNSFEATYENYSVADNIARIARSLGEKPNELVKHYYINATKTNLDKIVDILWRTYGSPEILLDSLIKKAKEVKAVDLEKPYTVIKFGTAVDVLTTNIISFNQLSFLHDRSILSELVKKLPPYLQHQWYWQVMQSPKTLTINDFNSFIQPTVDIARMQSTPYQEESNYKRGKKIAVCAAVESPPKPVDIESKPDPAKLCFYCEKGAHSIRKCFAFKKLTLKEKWEFVKSKKLCFKCFTDAHGKEKCETPNCKIDDCGKPHNPLLHYSKRESAHFAQESSDDESEEEDEAEEPDCSASPPEQVTTACNKSSLPVVKVKVFGPKGSETVFALLDTGSTITLIDKQLAGRCGISGEAQTLSFSQFQGKVTEDSEKVSLSIQGTQRNAKKFKIANVRTTSNLQMTAGGFDMDSLKSSHPHLQKAKCKSLPLIKPQILLGSSCYPLFRAQDSYEGENLEGPAAYYSHLGWYVVPEGDTEFCHFLHESDRLEYDSLLHQEVKNFFSTENFGVAIVPNSEKSKDDKRALKLLEEYTVFQDGRWTTQLLWKDEKPQLPSSKGMALNRLRSMEKKMDKDPAFAKLVVSKFEDYMSKSYLIRKKDVDKKLLKIIEVDNAHKKWYLPWFFAYHPTKKPRLVIDAAAKSNGKCYNDFFLKGPDLLNPLQAVLMKFRQFKIPFTADVQEMFHRVLVAMCDWAAQTILYRGMDRNSEPEEYYIPVLFFGSIHSPASAIFALQQNAKRFQNQFPLAVFLILCQIYMDDLLAGGQSVKEASKLVKEIDFIHAEGGFNLTKWSSSNQEVLASIPEERRAHGDAEFHQKGEIVTDKTLGLWWNPKEDNFVFKISLHRVPKEVISGERRPTKRELTSAIMSLFDPIGFLAPLKIKALILMQEVWRSGVDWDDEIPLKIEAKWREWLQILPKVEELKIPRCLSGLINGGADSTLHVFCDASEEAFACAAYLVTQVGGRKIAEFVAGRARVAPLKSLTVPRLELQAAVMGSRLACKIKDLHVKELPQLNFVMWSDSKCVLKQIRSSTLRYKVFQSNRIGEITELTDVSSWRWVPSKLNVADDATRSDMESCEISQNSRWLSQPEFLLEDEDKWPQEEKLIITEDDHEDMGLKVLFAAEEDEEESLPIPKFRNLSTWNRLVRATAAVRVAARKFKDRSSPYKITIEDLEWAEIMLMKRAQLDQYSEEFSKLEKNESVSTKSKIFALSPTLNQHGLIVLGGRIDKTPGVREEVKRPPILDASHKLTKMLIVHHHEKGSHHGQERVLNELRQKVWIVGARAAVRSCWANCKECKLRVGKPAIPMMGQLPLGRLEGYQYPFQNCGVDFFGPILCTQRRSQVKRWGVIFTCLATRAIHLDLAEGLDANEMINALVRFSSIRNIPAKMYSDNGTNFHGGNREMKEEFQKLLKGNIRELSSVKGIEWHFNPPLGSHFGGIFERLIGSVKRCLAFSLKGLHPKEGILRTLLCEITNIINSRPLTYVSSAPADPECLTPNHFLKLKALPQQTIPGEYEAENYRKGWKYVQQLADAFWKRWVTEYVPTLARREKWHKPATPLKVGDLVLVVDELSPRSGWKKGLVIKTYPAKDGQVRFVDVKVAIAKKDKKGELEVVFVEYKRPVVKIIPLCLDDVA